MTERMTNDTTGGDVMAQIREGMEVYDKDEKKVGKVDSMFMGAAADGMLSGAEPARGAGPETTDNDSLIANLGRAFDDGLPEVMRKRLQHNGFIRVRGGFLRGDRFALREQIGAVVGDRVILNVRAEEMVGF
jgi:hypothetical protein